MPNRVPRECEHGGCHEHAIGRSIYCAAHQTERSGPRRAVKNPGQRARAKMAKQDAASEARLREAMAHYYDDPALGEVKIP